MRPLMTFEDIFHFMKHLCPYDVSIHRHFYQKLFINERDRKKKLELQFLRDVEELSSLIKYCNDVHVSFKLS